MELWGGTGGGNRERKGLGERGLVLRLGWGVEDQRLRGCQTEARLAV